MRTNQARLITSILLSSTIAVAPVAQATDQASILLAKAIGEEAEPTPTKPKPQAKPKQPTKPGTPASAPASAPAPKPETPVATAKPATPPESPPAQGVNKTWIWVGAGVAALLALAAGGGGGGGAAPPPHP